MLFAFLHSFFYRCIGGVSRGYMACVDMFTLIFIVLRERGREGGRERERNISVWLPLTCPLLGAWPTTQSCALIGSQTSNSLVHRPVLNPLSHTSQGYV